LDVGQTIYDLLGDSVLELTLPSKDHPLSGGTCWGDAGVLFTPAYWKTQLWYAKNRNPLAYLDYATGTSLHDEVAACLLGGYGISAEMAQAAFAHLHQKGLLAPGKKRSAASIEKALRSPMRIGEKGRRIRYRFPQKKSGFIAAALNRLDREEPPAEAPAFREWLRSFDGIGWKTASWITRNWTHSNEVAVIDIHVFRAGVIAGIFQGGNEANLSARYPELEASFLHFSDALGEEARRLDVLIWRTMKDSARVGIGIFRATEQYQVAAA
jgi:thermostable 8-oxoguanine DNA glycosylase